MSFVVEQRNASLDERGVKILSHCDLPAKTMKYFGHLTLLKNKPNGRGFEKDSFHAISSPFAEFLVSKCKQNGSKIMSVPSSTESNRSNQLNSQQKQFKRKQTKKL